MKYFLNVIHCGIFAFFVLFTSSVGSQPKNSDNESTIAQILAKSAAPTTTEHQTLSAYFHQLSQDMEKKRATHEYLRKRYEQWGLTLTLQHCSEIIEQYSNLAREYQAMADEHATLAQ